jgi:hypothetical protein
MTVATYTRKHLESGREWTVHFTHAHVDPGIDPRDNTWTTTPMVIEKEQALDLVNQWNRSSHAWKYWI